MKNNIQLIMENWRKFIKEDVFNVYKAAKEKAVKAVVEPAAAPTAKPAAKPATAPTAKVVPAPAAKAPTAPEEEEERVFVTGNQASVRSMQALRTAPHQRTRLVRTPISEIPGASGRAEPDPVPEIIASVLTGGASGGAKVAGQSIKHVAKGVTRGAAKSAAEEVASGEAISTATKSIKPRGKVSLKPVLDKAIHTAQSAISEQFESKLKQLVNEEIEKLFGTNDILFIKPSSIHGLGVFSGEYIPKGTDLGIAQTKQGTGHKITPLGKHHNHSNEPSCINVSNDSEKHLVTSRDLEPDEEITINYILQPDLEQPLEDWV